MKKSILSAMACVTVSLFGLATQAQASVSGLMIQKLIDQKRGADSQVTLYSAKVGAFDQKLDHFNSQDKRTFKQRYAVYDLFAAGVNNHTAPVIYYQCGEGNCLMNAGSQSASVPGGVAADAKALHAIVVILEHRYYGDSQPFAEMTAENLKYLTYEQALEDFATFQMHASQTLELKGKWIFVGGSYSGALSAYYRLKHPELVVGALSSSGVVKTEALLENYDLFVAKGLGPKCLHAVQSATHQVELNLNHPEKLLAIKKLFRSEEVRDPVDFLTVLQGMVAFAVQYGQQAGFCREVLANADPVQGFADGGNLILDEFGVSPVLITAQGSESVDAKNYTGDIEWRQWNFQSCLEFGAFAVPYHDPKLSAQSALIDAKYAQGVCKRLFGMTQAPQTEKINRDFYLPLLDPSVSNILYTNGSKDPYSPLSISAENGNNINPHTDAYTIVGGSHATDLNAYDTGSPAGILEAQLLFQKLAKGWLGI